MTATITGKMRAWLGALAFAGAVGGHMLAYALVEPGEHERTELLLSTGHGLWPVVAALALAALVAGLAGCLRDGARRLLGPPRRRPLRIDGRPHSTSWSERWASPDQSPLWA